MIRLYQNEWHSIEFNSFTKCDKNNIANKEFYDKFYTEFFKKYKNFDDLDLEWASSKNTVANQLLMEIKDKKSILSIGCGIGVVEKYLIDHKEDIDLTAIEPSQSATRWVSEIDGLTFIEGYFPKCIENKKNFDLVYANAIDYVFSNKEYIDFLKSIIDYGIKEFVMISVSYYIPSYKSIIKNFAKDLLSNLGLYKRCQFWGYQRSIEEQFTAIKSAGFNNISLVYQSDDTIIIKAIV